MGVEKKAAETPKLGSLLQLRSKKRRRDLVEVGKEQCANPYRGVLQATPKTRSRPSAMALVEYVATVDESATDEALRRSVSSRC